MRRVRKIRKITIKRVAFMLGLSLFSTSYLLTSPSYAIDKSRLFASTAIITSVGLKFYVASLDKNANQLYDEYLHTANQSLMKGHLDSYENKRSQSVLTSRISGGLAALALIYSIFDEANQEKEDIGKKLEKGQMSGGVNEKEKWFIVTIVKKEF